MNLAFCLSKLRKLSNADVDIALEWLQDLISDKIGGAQDCTMEVCKYAHASLIKNN